MQANFRQSQDFTIPVCDTSDCSPQVIAVLIEAIDEHPGGSLFLFAIILALAIIFLGVSLRLLAKRWNPMPDVTRKTGTQPPHSMCREGVLSPCVGAAP